MLVNVLWAITRGRVSGISEIEWWNELLEWHTGMDWDKLAHNL